mgnify:CR=1 FL=1
MRWISAVDCWVREARPRIGAVSQEVRALAVIVLLKGKVWTGLVGMFITPLLFVGAIRLSRPHAPWARWRYSADKRARAQRRTDAFDDRWAPVRRRWDDFIGGAPTRAE